MEKIDNYEIQFVGYMPDEFKQGILYISMRGKIVIHLCACGCGEKVVTPISPDDWKLTFDGKPFRSILPLEIGISLADHTILFGIIEVYLLKIGKKNKYRKRRKNPRKVFFDFGKNER